MQVELIIIILLLILGFIYGNIATIAGIGGGVMYVPTLVLLLLLPMDVAIGTSIFVILISSGAGFFTYLKDKRTNWKLTITFGSFSILGSLACTILFQILFPIDNSILKIIFAIVLMITGFIMLRKSYKSKIDSKNSEMISNEIHIDIDFDRAKFKKSIPLFFLAGFLANLIGIGGGVINTPSLHMILGYSIHYSTAISTSIIFITAIYNTIAKSLFGLVNFIYGLLMGLGSVLGAISGAKISKRIPKIYLQILISITLIVLAIRMFF